MDEAGSVTKTLLRLGVCARRPARRSQSRRVPERPLSPPGVSIEPEPTLPFYRYEQLALADEVEPADS